MRAGVRAVHISQDMLADVLHRQIEVIADVRQALHRIQQALVHTLGIAVQRAQPVHAGNRGDLLDQLRQLALAAVVRAVARRVLRDERKFLDALRRQLPDLGQNIRLRAAAVAAADHRNRAIRAPVVASLADADVGAVFRRGQHAAKFVELSVVVGVNGAAALCGLLNGLIELLIVVHAHNHVHLGHLLADGLRVALRKAARRHQQAAAARLLVARHFKQRGDGFFLCGLDEAAGVDDDDLRPRRVGNDLIAVLLEHREHLLGIDAIFAASQRDQPNCCCQNDCSFNCRSGKLRL